MMAPSSWLSIDLPGHDDNSSESAVVDDKRPLGSTRDLIGALVRAEAGKASGALLLSDGVPSPGSSCVGGTGAGADPAATDPVVMNQETVDKVVGAVASYARRYKLPRTAGEQRKKDKERSRRRPLGRRFVDIGDPELYDNFRDADLGGAAGDATRLPLRLLADYDESVDEAARRANMDRFGDVREGIPSTLAQMQYFNGRSLAARNRWKDPAYRNRMVSARYGKGNSVGGADDASGAGAAAGCGGGSGANSSSSGVGDIGGIGGGSGIACDAALDPGIAGGADGPAGGAGTRRGDTGRKAVAGAYSENLPVVAAEEQRKREGGSSSTAAAAAAATDQEKARAEAVTAAETAVAARRPAWVKAKKAREAARKVVADTAAIDGILRATNITTADVLRALAAQGPAEAVRRSKLRRRYSEPQRWMADRLDAGTDRRRILWEDDARAVRQTKRSEKALRSWETRRENAAAAAAARAAEAAAAAAAVAIEAIAVAGEGAAVLDVGAAVTGSTVKRVGAAAAAATVVDSVGEASGAEPATAVKSHAGTAAAVSAVAEAAAAASPARRGRPKQKAAGTVAVAAAVPAVPAHPRRPAFD
ncbi:unnamed protein product [Phaeothamnion confervicola]